MIYSFFKKIMPSEISGAVEVEEASSKLRLGILKMSEGHFLEENMSEFNLIPSGAFNPIRMIPIKNYQQLQFRLTPLGEKKTRIDYLGRLKWAGSSAMLYTGVTYFLLSLFLFNLIGEFLSWSNNWVTLSWIILIVLGVSFSLAFCIDYFLIFSKNNLTSSIQKKIIFRLVQLSSLLENTDEAVAEKSITRESREKFVKLARKKGILIFLCTILENFAFLGACYIYNKMIGAPFYRAADSEHLLILFLIFTLSGLILYIVAWAFFIFYQMSNIKGIMDRQNIPGKSSLSLAHWFATLPILSLLASFFAAKAIKEIK